MVVNHSFTMLHSYPAKRNRRNPNECWKNQNHYRTDNALGGVCWSFCVILKARVTCQASEWGVQSLCALCRTT
eukprot:2740218-Amphidinium_carterae.1